MSFGGKSSHSSDSNRPKALFINLSERMVESPRQNRQMNALADEYDIYTVGIGPPPTKSIYHVDVSYSPRFTIRNIDVCAFPRVVFFMFLCVIGCFSLAHRLQPTAGNTLSPRRIIKLIPTTQFEIVCGRDLQSFWACQQVPSVELVWIDLPDFTPLQQEHDNIWRKTWGRYFQHAAQLLAKSKALTTTVTEGLSKRFQEDFQITPHLLLNVPPYRERVAREQLNGGAPLRLVHSGAAIRSRGLHLMIEAVCRTENVTLDMVLLPTDQNYLEELKQLSRGKECINFRSPVELNHIITDLRNYDCALIVIAPQNFNYANCLPNKFFEAIQARIPIISGPTPDMKRIIEEYDIGTVATDFSVDAISQAIYEMKRAHVGDHWKQFEIGLDECAKLFCASEEDAKLADLISRSLANLRI